LPGEVNWEPFHCHHSYTFGSCQQRLIRSAKCDSQFSGMAGCCSRRENES